MNKTLREKKNPFSSITPFLVQNFTNYFYIATVSFNPKKCHYTYSINGEFETKKMDLRPGIQNLILFIFLIVNFIGTRSSAFSISSIPCLPTFIPKHQILLFLSRDFYKRAQDQLLTFSITTFPEIYLLGIYLLRIKLSEPFKETSQ